MSLNEITFDILSVLTGTSLISDDTAISLDLIRYKVVNTRAMLIRQDLNKGRSLSDNIMQSLYCTPFIEINESLCPCQVPSDCTILRTENKLPKFIELHQRDLVTKVSGPGISSTGYSIIPYSRVPYAGLNKETKDSTKAFLYDSYIYLINPAVLIQYGTIRGVFEDPRDAANYANCDGDPCWTNDSEFPISAHMVNTLKELVIKDLTLLMRTPQDTKADERFNKPLDSK